MPQVTRREMLQTTLGSAAALALGTGLQAEEKPIGQRWKVITFTKFLHPLGYEAMADAVAELGFDGIEAPIRNGGYITPDKVADELPKFVEALKMRDLTIDVLTSSINSVDSPNAEQTLKVAKELGIPRYRMDYYRYDLKKPILPQLREAGAKLKDLAAMNAEIGIQAVYQNHSGDRYVGAPVWDIMQLVKQYDVKHVAMALDIGHARVEGGKAWPLHWALVQPHLGAVYIKDFRWDGAELNWCSVTEGTLSDRFFELLKASEFEGPISLHVEYLHGLKADEMVAQNLAAQKRDLAWLRQKLQGDA